MIHVLEKKATSKPDNKLANIPTQLEYSKIMCTMSGFMTMLYDVQYVPHSKRWLGTTKGGVLGCRNAG